MRNRIDFLAAYDEQLRTDAETPSAIDVSHHGPLRLVTFPGGLGFVTYQSLAGVDVATTNQLIPEVLARYLADPDIRRVEWKTRGHDTAPGLHEGLLSNGFIPDDPESIMIGEARLLDVNVALPREVTLRMVTTEPDVRAMSAMADDVFGDPVSEVMTNALLHRLSLDDSMQLWVAEVEGRIVGAGRLEPVRGTAFAGIWGGATRPEWRGKGIYSALTSVRARSALDMGKTLIHSDSTEYSRPILEQAGLIKVSTTTPYHWCR